MRNLIQIVISGAGVTINLWLLALDRSNSLMYAFLATLLTARMMHWFSKWAKEDES